MYLKPDDLLKYGGCFPGYSFMSRYYPDGVELIEVMRHKYMTDEFLHWGMDNLDTNDDEKVLYYELLNINVENPRTIYHCKNISNSAYVSWSTDVEDSTYVRHSSNITSSKGIISSDCVEDSVDIDKSNFVYSSHNVIESDNVTNSQNIVKSKYVVDATSIYECSEIMAGRWIRNSSKLEDCYFCTDCSNLKHSIFCCNTEGEYKIFNQQVDARQFELIKKQLFSILKAFELHLIEDRGVVNLGWGTPAINRNYIKQYQDLPASFWKWLRTLPGYDAMLMYQITFQPDLLETVEVK